MMLAPSCRNLTARPTAAQPLAMGSCTMTGTPHLHPRTEMQQAVHTASATHLTLLPRSAHALWQHSCVNTVSPGTGSQASHAQSA